MSYAVVQPLRHLITRAANQGSQNQVEGTSANARFDHTTPDAGFRLHAPVVALHDGTSVQAMNSNPDTTRLPCTVRKAAPETYHVIYITIRD